MKLSQLFLGFFGALTLASSSGCFFIFDNGNRTGDAEFSYVLLVPDANGDTLPDAAIDCNQVGVDSIRLMVGNDQNFDRILDDVEISDEATDLCNQSDSNLDGFIDQNEIGFFSGVFFDGSFDLFAVEFLDFNGNARPWQTFSENVDFTRFTFDGGVTVNRDAINILVFAGDDRQTDSQELQAFFGF